MSKIGASAVFDAIDQGDLESSLEVFGSFVDQTDAEDFGSNLDLPAVAAAIYRLLSQLDADERYELLKDWTLPDDDRLTIRQLTSMVPQSAPPKEFARLLGERPSEASFAMAEINGIRSLFSSGWLLAKSAEDSGRRRSLEAELEPLVEQEIAGARSLLTLVKLAADRVDAEPLAQLLLDRRSVIEAAIADGNESVSASAMAIAAAALKHEELQAVAENVFSALEEQTLLHGVGHIRAFVRMARVTALQHSSGESAPEILHRNRLLHWVPAESTTRASSSRGYSSPIWLTHEDHILHLAGEGNNDVLFFRYPLVGEFSLTCESQVGGRIKTGGGLVYGGLAFRAYRYNTALTILDADSRHTLRMPCPFVRPGTVATFNRLALRSSADHWSYEVNHRPVWSVNSTDTSPHSPWVGLSAVAGRRPLFRNLRISGNPKIPREVALVHGDVLRGWRSGFYVETQPNPFEDDNSDSFDWMAEEGVIQSSSGRSGRLIYQRPLLNSESVSYEFFYQEGKFHTHPSIGRLAFRIDPDGIKVRWLTDGAAEWTRLPLENALLEPFYRRGPRTPPLKKDDWNEFRVELTAGKVLLTLNGTQVYQRPLDFVGPHSFGLYHGPQDEAVRVRNVIMTGDWPEELPEECRENPTALTVQN